MKAIANIFVVLGLLVVGYWTAVQIKARLYQSQETSRFAVKREATASRLQSHPEVRRPYPRSGSTLGLLEIPRVGLSTIVVEGSDERELKLGLGHIPGTSLPGDGGNVGIAGHRDSFFRPLRLIRTNYMIKMITEQQEHQYKVVSTLIVEPADVQVLYPTGSETLTLVTCYPFDFLGAAPKRFIVRADCVDCSRQGRGGPEAK
jgi:sortase A